MRHSAIGVAPGFDTSRGTLLYSTTKRHAFYCESSASFAVFGEG